LFAALGSIHNQACAQGRYALPEAPLARKRLIDGKWKNAR
jgi:hypothetical protein